MRGAYAKDGEVFILDMGKPVRIYDLTRKWFYSVVILKMKSQS